MRSGVDESDKLTSPFAQHQLYRLLGFFSVVGFSRLHCLFGDYYQALKVLANVDFSRSTVIARVPACYMSLCYHAGFAYLMTRRYQDAARVFSQALSYMLRSRTLSPRSYQTDIVRFCHCGSRRGYHKSRCRRCHRLYRHTRCRCHSRCHRDRCRCSVACARY
jgi:hypothetical protein